MFKRSLHKPDGRRLTLYSRQRLDGDFEAPSPEQKALEGAAHFRWHPLREEWVAYAAHRQNRTFQPPPEYNPLAQCMPGGPPTELPSGDYDVAVFDNLFPVMRDAPPPPPLISVPTLSAYGHCEVVVFTNDPSASLGSLPLSHLELIIDVWADRTHTLGARKGIEYVFPFENRGAEVGVTLQHPHGQVYAFPFVPPLARTELAAQAKHVEQFKVGLLEMMISNELSDGRRVLYSGPEAIAFVPICARYAYEIWVAPKKTTATLDQLRPEQVRDLAKALKTTLLKLDGLWNRPFPYVLTWHQGPTAREAHPGAHLHLEIYPPYRMPGRLKYLAGVELGTGLFAADTLPEDKASELKAVEVHFDDR